MRIRKKPKKPARKQIVDTFYVDFDSVVIDGIQDELLRQVKMQLSMTDSYYKKAGITSDSYATLVLKQEYDYEYTSWHVVGTRSETDEEFGKRTVYYKKKLKDYNEWYAENEDEIRGELEVRRLRAENKNDTEIKRLETQLRKLKNG